MSKPDPAIQLGSPPLPLPLPFQPAIEYLVDSWQRSILYLDILRERGNQYLEHSHSGKPPVLVFAHEIILDARELPHPANYALAHILPPEGYPASNPKLRPFVVIDPRAGHGPGIGGFKMDSEIGIALQEGHPCYFVMFFPEPVPGQTIESVARAEAVFLQKVHELHPQAEGMPFVIGNCQGGWALMMLAAAAPELVGPILLAGSPISYWAGVEGRNPMRYSGGLLGGTWLSSLTGDLGHGKFDGAHLVTNFEQLDPANTYWKKPYNLYARVDTERERFLEFERWWGGHYLLNKEEMEWITQNLFVGNKLTAGEIETHDGKVRIDIRNIRSPIVVFASWGDNITPPQQALDWIPDVYTSVEDIRLNEQTIVYCLHEKVGHLGIFVSASVAQKQTNELISTLDLIDTLPPGLYEAIVEDTRPEMPGHELLHGRYFIRFEPRTIDDILELDTDGRGDEAAFQVVKRVAEINQGIYDIFISPLVKTMSSEASAKLMRQLHPARMERWFLSDLNPAMAGIRLLAEQIRKQRQLVSPENPLLQVEQRVSESIEESLDAYRDSRDAAQEKLFKAIYESPLLAPLVGLEELRQRTSNDHHSWVEQEYRRLKTAQLATGFAEGGLLEGFLRVLFYTNWGRGFDERPYNLIRRYLAETGRQGEVSQPQMKEACKRQAFLMQLDLEQALATLPQLIEGAEQRQRTLHNARKLLEARGALDAESEARLDRLAEILGVTTQNPPATTAEPPAPPARKPRRSTKQTPV